MIRSDDSDSDSPLCESTLPSSNGEPSESKLNIYLPLSRLSPTKVDIEGSSHPEVTRNSSLERIDRMFYMVIQDQSGIATAKVFGKEAEKYFPILEIGNVFEISQARVVASSSGRNALLLHPWEIIFTFYTQLALRTPSTIPRKFLMSPQTTCSSGRATTRSRSRDPTLRDSPHPSQQNVRGCSQDSSEEQSQRGGDFACLWVPAFLQNVRGCSQDSSEEQSQRGGDFACLWACFSELCETLLDLEGVLERCTADWLLKAQILEDPSPEKPRGNPNGRKRNQNRQMQKARRQIKLKAYEARKIQRLFNIYPRRAVREVLGDRSPSYDGTVEAAEEYLERTYHRSSLPSQQCQSARVLYDTCDWSHPSRDQMDFLNRAPSQKSLRLNFAGQQIHHQGSMA
ncbi:hypothetical protein OUZ56_021389 [Daphnia magna]|uniref:Uncharacterized protein n=1 Tax=Daphnia magna TaxID=35525 RepID=A0ABQ9ZH80_9CRUS|nr:hypothetical protein OUZ56_021389 [Daphnia magna]